MKIATWNVNGVRAALNKGVDEWWNSQDLDVLCLQEIKAMPEQLTEEQHAQFGDLISYWNPAVRKGYSGVATFTKKEPIEIQMGLGNARFDNEGRVIQTRIDDFMLFNIYFPNGQRDHGRLQYKLDFYAYLLDFCDQLHAAGDQIILSGDFNTAHQPIDLKNPKQNENTSGFLPVERTWIDRFLKNGFVDIFRKKYPEREAYTWWTYRAGARARNIGWRLDYFLISKSLEDRVEDVIIFDEVDGSDHCPVVLEIVTNGRG
jgi:exodeoxyribonuclease-3